jgi:hypothetical protein
LLRFLDHLLSEPANHFPAVAGGCVNIVAAAQFPGIQAKLKTLNWTNILFTIEPLGNPVMTRLIESKAIVLI